MNIEVHYASMYNLIDSIGLSKLIIYFLILMYLYFIIDQELLFFIFIS